jgi:hypothetical protein
MVPNGAVTPEAIADLRRGAKFDDGPMTLACYQSGKSGQTTCFSAYKIIFLSERAHGYTTHVCAAMHNLVHKQGHTGIRFDLSRDTVADIAYMVAPSVAASPFELPAVIQSGAPQ